MSLIKRLFGPGEPPKARIRVCVECGMPVADHKSWCSILRGQAELNRKAVGSTPTGASPAVSQSAP